MSKEYESREFCRDIQCTIQGMLDGKIDKDLSEKIKKFRKEFHCHENCKAYEFHQWLEDNGYSIIKKA